MYKIFQNDKLIGITEDDKYARRADNGRLVSCGKKDAEGVMFKGTFYKDATVVESIDLSVSEILSEIVFPVVPTVVANPSGAATTDLSKIQVGSTIYSVGSSTAISAVASSTS